jgi:hypothetical protein
LLNVFSGVVAAFTTFTGTSTVSPSNVTRAIVSPSTAARRRLSSPHVANAGLSSVTVAVAVPSTVTPSGRVFTTTSRCASAALSIFTLGGYTATLPACADAHASEIITQIERYFMKSAP